MEFVLPSHQVPPTQITSRIELGHDDNNGIVHIETAAVPPLTTPLFLLFSIDVSGSMSMRYGDAKSSLEYVKMTMNNIIQYLVTLPVEVYVCIQVLG